MIAVLQLVLHLALQLPVCVVDQDQDTGPSTYARGAAMDRGKRRQSAHGTTPCHCMWPEMLLLCTHMLPSGSTSILCRSTITSRHTRSTRSRIVVGVFVSAFAEAAAFVMVVSPLAPLPFWPFGTDGSAAAAASGARALSSFGAVSAGSCRLCFLVFLVAVSSSVPPLQGGVRFQRWWFRTRGAG